MALTTLFIDQNPVYPQIQRVVAGQTSMMMLDVEDREVFKSECEITQHPIENGSPITDHVVLKPNTFTLEGIVTETPITLGASLQGAFTTVGAQLGAGLTNAIGGGVGGTISKLGLGSIVTGASAVGAGLAGKTVAGLLPQSDKNGQAASGFNRLTDTIRELQAARDNRLPVTIITGLGRWPSSDKDQILVRSFTVERTAKSGRSIRVVIEFQQILITASQTGTPIPKSPDKAARKSFSKQSTKALSTDQSSNANTTLLRMGTNKFGITSPGSP